LLVGGDNIFYFALSCRERVIVIFLAWANNEMTTYETKIMERLKILDVRRNANSDRLEKLIETKDNDQYLKLEKLIEKIYIMINMLNMRS
jgi:hypothetical protein